MRDLLWEDETEREVVIESLKRLTVRSQDGEASRALREKLTGTRRPLSVGRGTRGILQKIDPRTLETSFHDVG